MSDIDSIDLSRYKLLIFTSPQLMTKEVLCNIQSRILPECGILFTELPGVSAGDLSLERSEEILGIKLYFDAESCSVTFADGNGGFLRRNQNLWLSLDTTRVLESFDAVADAVDLKRYISTRGVVHGNDLLFGVFATKDKGIKKCRLPKKADWYEWFTGKIYLDTDEAEIDLPPKGAGVFVQYSLWKEIEKTRIVK